MRLKRPYVWVESLSAPGFGERTRQTRAQQQINPFAVNTDAQTLLMSEPDVKLDIGRDLSRVHGAGRTRRSAGRRPRSIIRRWRSSGGPTWSS